MTVADGTNPAAIEEPAAANPEADDALDAANLIEEPEDEQDAEPEVEEIDWEDGKRYAIPKALKGALMKEADYRQKTMAHAEQRRAWEAERETERQFLESHRREVGQLTALENAIEQYKQVDWATWRVQDPDAAQAARWQYEQYRDAHQELSAALEKAKQAESDKARQATADRLRETAAFAEKNIRGWSLDVDAQITRYAMQEYGFDRGELAAILNPKTYRALHRLWSLETAASRSKNPPPRQAEALAAAPVTPVARGRAPAQQSALSDKASIRDWMKARNKQVSGRQG